MQVLNCIEKNLLCHQIISYNPEKNKGSWVQDTYGNYRNKTHTILFIKWQKTMYYYESVYEIQNAELFPRLLKQHEVNKCGNTKN